MVSVPTLLLVLFCLPSFSAVTTSPYANAFTTYLLDLLGRRGALTVLMILYIDGTLSSVVCFLSAQRITYAIARDGIIPCSTFFARLTPSTRLPVNAGILVAVLSIGINASYIGSAVAFDALTATATIAVNVSYLIPIVARHTIARHTFEPAEGWKLGRWSPYVAVVAGGYICFIFVVLMLPQVWPVTAVSNAPPFVLFCLFFFFCFGILFLTSLASFSSIWPELEPTLPSHTRYLAGPC